MLNGKILDAPIDETSEPSYTSGDSVFETIRYASGKCFLWDLHFDRLSKGIKTFHIDGKLTKKRLEKDIVQCCNQTGSPDLKIRITVFPESSFNRSLNCLLEVSHIDPPPQVVKKITTTLFADEIKPIDITSSSKSGNRNIYTQASQFAAKNGADDSFIMNELGNIIEATISNVFIISQGYLTTPPVTDGCVDGTMRRHLIDQFDSDKIEYQERSITVQMLENADEVFLTNAVRGIISVSQFKSRAYEVKLAQEYYQKYFLAHL